MADATLLSATQTLGSCRIDVLGTIAGFVPDADRVQEALVDGVEAVALGIPPEDLDGLALFADVDDVDALIDADDGPHPDDLDPAGTPGLEGIHDIGGHADERTARAKKHKEPAAFAALDDTTQRLLELLTAFGPTRVPSPDLHVAHAWSQENTVPLVALDLDDEAHSTLYTRLVGFRHAWKNGRILDKLLKEEFDAKGAHDLALQWDAFANQQKPLQAVEAAREAHMAKGLADLAAQHRHVVAVVPVARLTGVLEHLRKAGDADANA